MYYTNIQNMCPYQHILYKPVRKQGGNDCQFEKKPKQTFEFHLVRYFETSELLVFCAFSRLNRMCSIGKRCNYFLLILLNVESNF